MWNIIPRTFGQPALVSCGKFRIVRFCRFCLLCLTFGLFALQSLQAQGPGGGAPSEGGGRGGGDRGGRGGFDPSQFISGMDKDGNGVITANEIEQLPGPFRDRLQQGGMDFNKGVRVEEMQQNFQRQMEERRQGGGGEDRGRDRERGFERSDRPEYTPPQEPGQDDGREGRGDRRDSGAPGGGSAPSSSSKSPSTKPRTRISALLPEAYKALDTDFDGQIALYEWRKGKRGTISQFTSHDINGDGFLIAKELTQATAAVTSPTTSTPAAAPKVAVAAVAAPVAPLAPVAVSVEAATKALGAFELLDTDKSGTVLGKEWDKSTRLKPKFEKGGINLALPLDKDQFTQAYVRVGADK